MISRADIQAAHGISHQSLYLWYRDRAATGHPEPAGQIGKTTYWYADDWLAWYQSHQASKVEVLTQVDRSGDPDDLVDAKEAARILGYASGKVIHTNRRDGYFPEPDAYDQPGRERPSPRWRRSTVWAIADARHGRGGGRRPGIPSAFAKPHPYAGDPRLEAVLAQLRSGAEPSSTALAAAWAVSRRTAERIISAARQVIAD